MNERQPPRLATWLLTHLCYGPRNDSFIGDLHEQFAAGKSEAWYWRQSVIGLATGAVNFARAEGPPLIGALAAAWCVMVLAFALNGLMVESLPVWGKLLRPHLGVDAYLKTVYFIDTSIRFAMFVFAGWILVRLQPRHRYVALVLLLATAALWRFVPQRIPVVFGPGTLVAIHMSSGIVGILVGALLFGRFTNKNAVPR